MITILSSYYIFFIQKGDKYIVTYIGNNHTDAQYL